MSARRFLIQVLGFLFVIGLCPWLSASSAFASTNVSTYSQPVFSDFDGDNRVDQAELFSNGTQKRIHVSLGKFAWKSLFFDSGGVDRGHIVSRDIDSDGDTDLIWISQDNPKTFVTWLGDGRGNFELAQASEPQLHRLGFPIWDDGESRLADGEDGAGLGCILLTTTVAASQSAAVYRYSATSLKRSFSGSETAAVFASFLSAIRKRGPPSRLLNNPS